MAHGVVRTDNLRGTKIPAGLISVRFMNGANKAAIDNGNIAKIEGLEEDSRSIFVAKAPTKATKITDIVLLANPEVDYDERKVNLDEYTNEAGKAVRGYHLYDNDEFGVTADCVTAAAAIAKGDIVELDDSTKLKIVKSATSGSTKVGVVEAIEKAGRYEYIVIRVTL